MKLIKAGIIIATLTLCFSIAFAAGDAASGKKLFNDPSLGGSTNSRSCDSCHPGGAKLEGSATKEWAKNRGAKSLEEMVNICITSPLKGKALALDSKEMKDIVAYIKSLGK